MNIVHEEDAAFTWTLESVDVQVNHINGLDYPDVVKKAYYSVTGEFEGLSYRISRKHIFDGFNITEFKQWVQLDNDMILDWVKRDLGEDNIRSIEAEICHHLTQLKYPGYENKIVNYDMRTFDIHRANEYPPMEDFLDAWVKNDADALNKYRADCLAVKQKYPKPE